MDGDYEDDEDDGNIPLVAICLSGALVIMLGLIGIIILVQYVNNHA